MDTEVKEELWEEKNSTEPLKSLERLTASDIRGSTLNIGNKSVPENLNGIMLKKRPMRRAKKQNLSRHEARRLQIKRGTVSDVAGVFPSISNTNIILSINKINSIFHKQRCNERISCVIRSRLKKSLKENDNIGKIIDCLGCSIEDFKKYIESKFQEGMTWENHGNYGWHYDHITPLSWFNLEDRNQFLIAAHYTNYQPLWARENLRKSDSYSG